LSTFAVGEEESAISIDDLVLPPAAADMGLKGASLRLVGAVVDGLFGLLERLIGLGLLPARTRSSGASLLGL
jgi:hypothetical protein